MNVLRSLGVVVVLVGITASCSDDGSAGDTSRTTATTPASSTRATSTPATTTAVTTIAPATTSATSTSTPPTTTGVGATTTTTVCVAPTETVAVVAGLPGPLSSMFGDDVDTGGHTCFERVVINFAGSGENPGYDVRYEKDPLTMAASGAPVLLSGDANLIVRVGAWMGEQGDFSGETQLVPANVEKIEEVTLIDNFEGVMIWGIGLDKERAFEVFTLSDPFRLVIDIAAG